MIGFFVVKHKLLKIYCLWSISINH